MKKLIFLLLVFAGFTACENESIQDLPQETSVTEDMNARMGDKIDVCHYDAENDSWHVINISANAWEGHEKHGDVMLVDADGDGWVANANECVPGGDCDDDDPNVNPGAEEICGDGIDNNCDGNVDENCSTFTYTCGADIDFSVLEFTYSDYCSNNVQDDFCGGEYPYSRITFEYFDSEGNLNFVSFSAVDLRNYTCDDGTDYDDYFTQVEIYNYQTDEHCIETYGCPGCEEDINLGPGTVEAYEAAVVFINNLAAELGIEDSCANGARSSAAGSVKNMQSMPDELKKIIEQRKALLPTNR